MLFHQETKLTSVCYNIGPFSVDDTLIALGYAVGIQSLICGVSFLTAYSQNRHVLSTGLIQWMLNNAWPEMVWHLYDYYLNPGGAFFGVKKALEPLHPMYAYDDSSLWYVPTTCTTVSLDRALHRSEYLCMRTRSFPSVCTCSALVLSCAGTLLYPHAPETKVQCCSLCRCTSSGLTEAVDGLVLVSTVYDIKGNFIWANTSAPFTAQPDKAIVSSLSHSYCETNRYASLWSALMPPTGTIRTYWHSD